MSILIDSSYRRRNHWKFQMEAAETSLEVDVGKYVAKATIEDYIWIYQVKDSAGKEKNGFKSTYDNATGILTIENDGGATFADGDIVIIIGAYQYVS